jgi:hypothetical protein
MERAILEHMTGWSDHTGGNAAVQQGRSAIVALDSLHVCALCVSGRSHCGDFAGM